MKKILSSFVLIAFIFAGCAKNQVTGRKQLILMPEKELQSMAGQQYKQFLTENKIIAVNVNKDAEMVRRVGTRIAYAITKYYEQQGKSAILEGYTWEFNLVDSKDVNAWCMPGGKVVVYTGLLPVTQNEAALAVVMGHEIAHAIALHGNERMSQGLMQQLGGVALSVAIANKPAETQNLFMTAYGVGSTVGGYCLFPVSRNWKLISSDYVLLLWLDIIQMKPFLSGKGWQKLVEVKNHRRF